MPFGGRAKKWLLHFQMVWGMVCVTVSPSHAGPYELSLVDELLYFGTAATLNTVGELHEFTKSRADEEELEALDKDDIPAFDRPHAGRWVPTSSVQSDAFRQVAVSIPLTLLFSENNDLFPYLVIYTEMISLTTSGVAYVKGTNTRFRPFAYDDKAPLSERLNRRVKRSFWSGHASNITAGFVFWATAFTDLHPGSSWTPWVWGTAVLSSVYGSWLRVEAGRHFPTDVIYGMLWGGLIGYSVPTLHKSSSGFALLPFIQNEERGILLVAHF